MAQLTYLCPFSWASVAGDGEMRRIAVAMVVVSKSVRVVVVSWRVGEGGGGEGEE